MTPALLKSSRTKSRMHKTCLGKSKESQTYQNCIMYRHTYYRLYASELTKYKYNAKKTLIGRHNIMGGISESFKINGNITNDKKIISNKLCELCSEIFNKYSSNIRPARKPFYRHKIIITPDQCLCLQQTKLRCTIS